MSSNSNNTPIQDSSDNTTPLVNQQQEDEQPQKQQQQKKAKSLQLSDIDIVTRSIKTMTSNSTAFKFTPRMDLMTEEIYEVIPSLPTTYSIDTIITQYTTLHDITTSLMQYLHTIPTVDCILDDHDMSVIYGLQYLSDQTSLSFTLRVYRGNSSSSSSSSPLHVECQRLKGCGIEFSRLYALIVKEFSVTPVDVWTFDQPTLLSPSLDDNTITSGANNGYESIPLFTTSLIEGEDVILPFMDDNDHSNDNEDDLHTSFMIPHPSPLVTGSAMDAPVGATINHKRRNSRRMSAIALEPPQEITLPVVSNVEWAMQLLLAPSAATATPTTATTASTLPKMISQALEVLTSSLDQADMEHLDDLLLLLQPVFPSIVAYMNDDDIHLRLRSFTLVAKLSTYPIIAQYMVDHITPEVIYQGLQLQAVNQPLPEQQQQQQQQQGAEDIVLYYSIHDQLMLREMFRATYVLLTSLLPHMSNQQEKYNSYQQWANVIKNTANGASARDELMYSQ